jgi:hypothetical protein
MIVKPVVTCRPGPVFTDICEKPPDVEVTQLHQEALSCLFFFKSNTEETSIAFSILPDEGGLHLFSTFFERHALSACFAAALTGIFFIF